MMASLPARSTPRSVRPRMAKDTERAERIRRLKADHPDMTWGYIADRVGVKERSAVEWQRTGGLSSVNADKLAEVLGVSFDYLWFGEERTRPTPDLSGAVSSRIDAKLDQVIANQQTIMAALEITAPAADEVPSPVPVPGAAPPTAADRERVPRTGRRAG
jgi:hypothetical protein